METYCNYLFVYGSLTGNDNEVAIYLKNNSCYYAEGYFNGLLYDLGEYPGAHYHPEIESKVYGDILQLNDKDEVLKIIDAYEGFGENEQQPNLFVRQIVPVTANGGTISCWVYVYNLSVDGCMQIASGRYK